MIWLLTLPPYDLAVNFATFSSLNAKERVGHQGEEEKLDLWKSLEDFRREI